MPRFPTIGLALLAATPVLVLVPAIGHATAAPATDAAPSVLTVNLDGPGTPISPELFGIFFEDLNYAADGGLYAELIPNRSFEYQATEQPTWNNLTAWDLVQRRGKGALMVDDAFPLHRNNPHYGTIAVDTPGDGVGLASSGYDGIPVTAGEPYELSFFARQNFFGHRWNDIGKTGPLPFSARLERPDGSVLAEAAFEITARDWRRFAVTLTPSATEPTARLVLLCTARGGIAFDEISLFPGHTFRDHPNGLRADLAQTIADLKPRFMRFPGGCLVHGDGLGNMYRWKDTIGPIEQRRQQRNLWGYHQSVGLGYFEYFQFCEDIGAQPVPVVAAGVCCQNSGQGIGQAGLPLPEMDAYIQDVLDLIEWANGPANSLWGARRAAAGHPAPFGLKFLGLGNEDQITSVFRERFQMIYDVVRARHPEITLIGTAGPFPDGDDFDRGWQIVDDLQVPMVDEHYYKSPQWFWDHLNRYDTYDRAGAQVYVGEYAAHDDQRRSTLRSALAEAAFLTSLERNGDIVHLASYAPLLARRGHTQWTPDLIYFDATHVYPTLNYTIQKLFGHHRGDTYRPTVLIPAEADLRLAASTVEDSATGDLILKLVNGDDTAHAITLQLATSHPATLPTAAQRIVFGAADADLTNPDGTAPAVEPHFDTVALTPSFRYETPAHSLTILRFPAP